MERPWELSVIAVAVTAIVWTLFFLAIRLYLRFKVNGPWGYDDYAASIATLFGLVHSSLVISSVRSTLGQHNVSVRDLVSPSFIQKEYVSTIFYILAICTSKISTSLLVGRLERVKHHLIIISVVIGLAGAWGISSIVVFGIQCRDQLCLDSYTLWLGIELAGILLELAVFALSLQLVWTLVMPMRPKVVVISAFAIRLSTIIPSALRIHTFHSNQSNNQAFDSDVGVDFVVITLIATHLSIMAATFPCMKQFLGAFDSGLIGGLGVSTGGTHFDSQQNHGSNHEMKSFSSSVARSQARRSKTVEQDIRLRPEHNGGTVTQIKGGGTETRDGDEGASVNSDSSGRAIIKKTQRWELHYQ
ncbi:hypothetical protein MBLNU459_g4256t1 [Dothideomycetes sp. NU459]